MAAGFVSYSVIADKAFLATLERAKDLDLRIPFRQIVKDFRRSEKAIFNLKGPGQYPDFKGPKVAETWKPVDASRGRNSGREGARRRKGNLTAYQNFKMRKKGFLYPLLKFTGRIEDSLTKDTADSIVVLGKQELAIGTSVPYSIYHQQDQRPGDKIPMRKLLFIGPESKKYASDPDLTGRLERWTNIINTFVLRSLGATPSEASGGDR